MNRKDFYEKHKNFSLRTPIDYFISPGIRCKFDLLNNYIGSRIKFQNGIDLGCSGNSFLLFLDNVYTKSFLDLANSPLRVYKSQTYLHPICGDLISLPYRNESFSFVSALDVLEHVNEDESAISEISRILRKNGIAVITVPHRMKYFTKQDQLIGHYRRYEIPQIINLFQKYHLKQIRTFGIYGQLMRIADTQSANPEKTEKSIENLRNRYEIDPVFRKFWGFAIRISSKVMKMDAKYRSLKTVMNIGFIFKKI